MLKLDDLKRSRLFVNWKKETKSDGSITKPPVDPMNPTHYVNISKSTSFVTYETALKNVKNGLCDGIGIVLKDCTELKGYEEYVLAGIDLDAHRCEKNQYFDSIYQLFEGTYCEISPSGNGYHFIFLVKKSMIPHNYKEIYLEKNSSKEIECYVGGVTNRYFTLTGNPLLPFELEIIEDKTEAWLSFLEKFMKKPLGTLKDGSPLIKPEKSLDIEKILEKARSSKAGDLFKRLYDEGDVTGFPSESEARMRLCGMLAFWFSKDDQKIKEVYQGSVLYKKRPDKAHDVDDLIKKAIANCKSTYACSEAVLLNPKTWNHDGSERYTLANLEYFLERNNIQLKLNVISREVEVCGQVGKYDFNTLKSAVGIIYNYLNVLRKCQEQKIKDDMEYLAEKHKYNPILDAIQATTWDGIDRLEELYELLHVNEDIEKIFIKKWLLQCIAALFQDEENPFALDLVLVFTGKQGVGKTRLLEHLAMAPKYFSEGISIDPTNKDSVRQATSCWIAELGEIGSTMKRDTDILKAFISQPKDTYRNPYARGPETYVRRTCFCGTANESEYLIDETGNRRFLSITLDDDVVLSMDQIRELDAKQLWAQVYKIALDSGLPPSRVFRFTTEEKKQLEEINKRHMKLLKGETEVLDLIAFLKTPDDHNQRYIEYQTATQFKTLNEEYLHGYSSQQIAKVLKKLGYEVVRKRLGSEVNPSKYYKLPAKHLRDKRVLQDTHIIDETID